MRGLSKVSQRAIALGMSIPASYMWAVPTPWAQSPGDYADVIVGSLKQRSCILCFRVASLVPEPDVLLKAPISTPCMQPELQRSAQILRPALTFPTFP